MGAPSGLGLWIWKHWECDGGRVDDIIARCHRSGVTWLAIKAADGRKRWFGATAKPGHWTLDVARANFRALRDANIGVYTWHYSYPSTYTDELAIMGELLGYEGVCGHIVDAEDEWEAAPQNAQAFADGITTLRTQQNAWVAHAPYYKPSVHGGFPFREFGAACDAVMPQAYWTARRGGVDEVTRTVDDETADFHAASDSAVAPIGITYGNATQPDETVIPFRADDLRTFLAHFRAKPFCSLWTYDGCDPALWPTLESLTVDAVTGAGANGLALIDAGGAGPLSRELADRVSAHLSRAMSTIVVPGGSLEERAATVRRKQANLVLSVNASSETRGGVTRSEVWTHTKSSDSSRRFGHALGRGLRATARSADLVMLRPEVVGPHAAACLVDVSVPNRHALDDAARSIARAVRELGPLPRRRRSRFGDPIGGGRSDLHCAVLEPHGGPQTNTILHWNVESPASSVDVAVHLHGYSPSQRGMPLTEKEQICGLDFYGDPDQPSSPLTRTRARDTLGILPRGRYTGDGTHTNDKGVVVQNDRRQYTFGGLTGAQSNLDDLITCGLGALGGQLSGTPTRNRLIISAHSGGGAALERLIALGHDPDEMHVFDAFYNGDVRPIISWALRHLRADANGISGMSDDDAVRYMQTSGGALRIFFITGGGTDTLSVRIQNVLACAMAGLSADQQRILGRYYRAQSIGSSMSDHLNLPRKLGWQLMQDAGADVMWKGAPLTQLPAAPSTRECRAVLRPYAGDWISANDDVPADGSTDGVPPPPAYEIADASNPEDADIPAFAGPFPQRFGAADAYVAPPHRRRTGRARRERFGAVTAGRQEIYEPLLHAHWPHTGAASGTLRASTGTETNVILLWNDISASSLSSVDVVVHFHGWRHPALNEANQFAGMAPHQKEAVSGLVLSGRTRPTLAILPRGQQGSGGGGRSMSFPQLAGGNLQTLIGDCLDWFATSQLSQSAGSLGVCRLVLAGHSGGGEPLQAFASSYDPDEEHVYDALYGDADGVTRIASWAKDRIARDIAALTALSAQADRESYMASQGGACRVFYLPDDTGNGTGRRSKALHQEITCAIGAASDPAIVALLTRFYRVQIATSSSTPIAHEDIPPHYEPPLLSSGGGDIPPASDPPGATCPTPTRSGYPTVTRRAACPPPSSSSGPTTSTDDAAPSYDYAGPDYANPYADPGDSGTYLAGLPLRHEEDTLYGEPYPEVLDGDPAQQWEPRIADAEAKIAQGMFRHMTDQDLSDLLAARPDFDAAGEGATHDDQVRRLRAVLAAISTWIADTSQSAIAQIPDPTQRQHLLTGVRWSQESFPGSGGARTQEAEALFDAMTGVVAERRITRGASRLPYHDISARLSTVPGTSKRLFAEATDAFVRLRDAATPGGVTLTILSAYRSEADQQRIRARSSNPNAVAQGTSPHSYGLAMDLALSVPGLSISETDTHSMTNMVSMYSSPVYKWMLVNAERFGFYPYKREPWHWEYNPPGFAPRYA